ncbi:MAG TPA: glycoside hydrolase family 38 C-terminal domain-containing protein [Candidatus Limnocylindrales bacterium]|nr:glycoside hydrolase family 38 C-terminal domain-containing protein [Candidatus Limnocylindrales bacterium]
MRRLIACLPALAALCLPLLAQTNPNAPDLTKQPTLYVVGYAHLDTEWRWEYPQTISEYLKNTLDRNFDLIEKYPHYIFNFSGANRYRLMKEYFPADFTRLKKYVDSGRWFPAGSSMEEGDVNAPSAEAIIREILYGNNWFRKELGKASAEYMLPDCFGFPASLPSILAHAGVKGFSTQKLTWGSSANAGGPESLEKTPEGTPFNVGVWVGPDGKSVVAALNPGSYSGSVTTDLSKPLPEQTSALLEDVTKKLQVLMPQGAGGGGRGGRGNFQGLSPEVIQQITNLRTEQQALTQYENTQKFNRFQGDWASRVENNGKVTGVFTDYHYYGTGDVGGSPNEASVKLLEAIVTKGRASLPRPGGRGGRGTPQEPPLPEVQLGEGPVHVVSAAADQLFLDLSPADIAELPRYTGEMELTNHSAGSLTSQAYQKRWIRKEELLADAAEKASLAAEWLGGRKYPMQRLNDAWTLAMAGHFHDIAAGTATPRAYEFAWNDDAIAMNQFAGVLTSGTQAVASALNTEGKGSTVVVYNPLNIAREDVVEAEVKLPAGTKSAHAVGPDGREVPAQISGGKVLFLAKVPSVGYAVYDVQPGAAAGAGEVKVSETGLENHRYTVKIDANGDVSSIYDKHLRRELLAAPVRLAISYDNPVQWPAWNMDWDQEQAAPRAYAGGPVRVRVVENGPVRAAVEISREGEGSKFVQTVSLSAGDAGNRVEFGNVVDWNTKESNLKATFALAASNQNATYNWDIGTIQRPTAEPKKFEVPSHQWIDLTDASGAFGATVLTDCKNGSDKPNDHTIRLTLIRTPGVRGGYADQGTQDLGHHEFVFGIAGHAGDWRAAQTDWQGYRLNEPLIAFETAHHAGGLGKELSLLKVSSGRVRVLAMKRAELSDEVVLRAVELDGRPQDNVRISFAAQVTSAREVNGQEQPVGPATVAGGALATSFTAFQPRTFAVKLAAAPAKVAAVQSKPVPLQYDVAAATEDGAKSTSGFDGKGNSLPAEMLPREIDFGGVQFSLAAAKSGTPDALAAKGQTLQLPAGRYNRVYVLAASADGDRKATFQAGGKSVELNVQDWGGFIGQWDDRKWEATETPGRAGGQPRRDAYGKMVRIVPGFMKTADLAWYCSHHHDAAGANVPYEYSYLFAYAIDLPAGAKTLRLPDDDKIRVMAVSVADDGPELKPAMPLVDTLK